jgi:hypothetical protein
MLPRGGMAGTRAWATKIYEQANITAAREFQRRRESDAYSAADIGIEEGQGYSWFSDTDG